MQTASQNAARIQNKKLNRTQFMLHHLKQTVITNKSDLRDFINHKQSSLMSSLIKQSVDQADALFYVNKYAELAEIVNNMPVHETIGKGMDAVAHLHYSSKDGDWYISHRDAYAKQYEAVGLAVLLDGRDLGCINIVELLANGAELDLNWTPKILSEIR